MTSSQLDLGLRCIKYLLCAVNFLFVLTGLITISIGTTIYAVYDDFSHFLDASYFSPATLLIIIGIFIFVIAFCGCCGAVKESTCMVLVFAVSLTLVLVLEFSAVVIAYILRDNVNEIMNERIKESMHDYFDNPEAKAAVDFLQTTLHCCGYNGYQDWLDATNATQIPATCCSWYIYRDIPEGADVCPNEYIMNCHYALSSIVNDSAIYVFSGIIVISFIQMTGIMFACTLGRAIRKQKTERERRRWQMRESILDGYEPLGKTDPFSAFPVVYMTQGDLPPPPATQTAVGQ